MNEDRGRGALIGAQNDGALDDEAKEAETVPLNQAALEARGARGAGKITARERDISEIPDWVLGGG